ncbi:MAG TPA: trypsin-like peptidase domain-containing protein [Myxococcales bacterium]|nr:trypsin-like peptidase domain-containing protein [Myxococcales bacterium]
MLATLVVAAAAAAAQAQAHKNWTDAPPAPRLTAPPASIAQLVKQAMPAVVGIVALTARGESRDPFHDFLDRMYGAGGEREQPVRGIGTGFFIRADGLIATNGHVVEGATDITVQIGEEERPVRGTLLGRDDATDLALVKIDGGPFPVLQLGDSDGLEVGEWVTAIGNPFGLSRSVTTGIVSFKGRRDVNPSGRPGYYDFIQTDAAINPGNSGGPLLDARGAVVAINAAVNPAGQGIGFAIPINMLKAIAPQLEKGRVARSWMGMSVQEQMGTDLAESFAVPGRKGVVITDVLDGGPAAQAGLRPGDVVVSFDGEPIAESYRLRWLTANVVPGRTVALGVWRNRAPRTVIVMLTEKPGDPPPPEDERIRPVAARKESEPFGLTVDEQRGDHGLRISAVDPRGAAYRAGLRDGDVVVDVDGRSVRDRAAFRRALSDSGALSRLYVRRNGRALFFALRREPAQTAKVGTR